MIPVVLMMGVLVDVLGKQAVVIVASLLIACALAVLARSKTYWASPAGRAAAQRRLGRGRQRPERAGAVGIPQQRSFSRRT